MPQENKMCRHCGGAMKPGKPIAQIWKPGLPDCTGLSVVKIDVSAIEMNADNIMIDFSDDAGAHKIGQTMKPGGPGTLVEVMKCEACGRSYRTRAETDPPC